MNMKYINNKIICSALSLATLLGMSSCGADFLKEDAGHMVTDALLEGEAGAEKMAAGLYANLRWHFGYEWAYGTTLYGCDEFTNGADLTSEPWNVYDNRLQPLDCTTALGAANGNCPPVSGLWDQMYYGISTANLVLEKAVNVSDEAARSQYLGEAYFLRGYNYYRLFAQYGGVVLQTEAADGTVQKNFTRASDEETLNQVIADLEQAYELLPTAKKRGNGSWTKYTAAHFLAKALLFRQSERCTSWNGNYNKSADLDRVISLCNEVIAACPLADNYSDLYQNWTGVDCAVESNPEILMSALFNDDVSTKGRFGNRTYSYFNPQFSNFSDGWVLRGQYIGLDFQRCRPTEYTYSTFDNVNDARMWKMFRTIYGVNTNKVMTDNQLADNGINADQAPTLGDKGILFILNKKDDPRFQDESTYGTFGRGGQAHSFIDPETGKWVPNVFPLYLGGKYAFYNYGVSGATNTSNVFCGINKTEDGSRTVESGGNESFRDVIMARTGETYLVKAEAQVRLGNYQDAINTVNVLRARAQWKSGEDREYYTDGNQAIYTNSTANALCSRSNVDAAGNRLTNIQAFEVSHLYKSSYYLSTGIDRTTEASNLQIVSYTQLPAEDEAILVAIGATSDYDRMLNFIFNERTRELLGEWNRWDELSRAGLLIKRAKAFNPEAAANITAGKHELRPIPQKFIDALQHEDGTNLSDAEKKAWQNPGY